jgi:uncharacterized membrane protein
VDGSTGRTGDRILLVLLGLTLILTGREAAEHAILLAAWNLLTILYVIGRMVSGRRVRDREPDRTGPARPRLGAWYQLTFTLAASIIGVGAAIDAIFADSGRAGDGIRLLAVLATVLAWILLHTAYARFYAARYEASGRKGLDFPATPVPGPIEMTYFAFTIGTTFAASDVSITTREMRWHVTNHSIISFFYNAAVLAIAIGALAGR